LDFDCLKERIQAILWPTDGFDPVNVGVIKYTNFTSTGIVEDLLVQDILAQDNPTVPRHKSSLYIIDPDGERHIFQLIHAYDPRLPLNHSVKSMTGDATWHGNILVIQRACTGSKEYVDFPLTSPDVEVAKAGLTRFV
jgi:hypothetical protein